LNVERTAGYLTVHYLARGVITNVGNGQSNPIQLKLTVLDHGQVIDEQVFSPVTETLQPGQSTEFSVPFTVSGNVGFDYRVDVVAE
jgi:hypothetical protein